MITTVTTTVTTTTTLAAASLALVAILTLIALLIQKEITSGLEGPRAQWLGRALNVAIVPLFIVFVSAVVFKVADVLR